MSYSVFFVSLVCFGAQSLTDSVNTLEVYYNGKYFSAFTSVHNYHLILILCGCGALFYHQLLGLYTVIDLGTVVYAKVKQALAGAQVFTQKIEKS